jgi:hypothetical protein
MTPPFLLKRLDAPVRFLSFSMNDLLAYLAPFFVGTLFDKTAEEIPQVLRNSVPLLVAADRTL